MRDILSLLYEAANQEIVDLLQQLGYETKVSGNRITVLTQIPDGKGNAEWRTLVLRDLESKLRQQLPDLGPHFSDQYPARSSIGLIAFDNDRSFILVKDTGTQGERSAGRDNEVQLAAMLSSMLEKYGTIDVTFKDSRGKTLKLDNVDRIDASGLQTKGRKKADVVLYSSAGRLPVSIKQVDADSYESADRLFGQRARAIIDKLVDEGEIILNYDNGQYRLENEIAIEPTVEEALATIFGSDISPEGGIVIQTFKPQHFRQNKNKIEIDAEAVIKDLEDIPESHLMMWVIRNATGRANKSMGLPGLRPMAVIRTRALGKKGEKPTVLVVDQDGNVIKRPTEKLGQRGERPAGPSIARPKARTGGVKSPTNDSPEGRRRRR
jgi:hypothetical protein